MRRLFVLLSILLLAACCTGCSSAAPRPLPPRVETKEQRKVDDIRDRDLGQGAKSETLPPAK